MSRLQSADDTASRRGDDDPEDILESCLEFMGSYVTKSLRIKYDKWQKLVTAEESKLPITQWFSNPSQLMLVITVNHYGALLARDVLTKEFPYKSCFFIRKSIPLAFKSNNFRQCLISGDTTSAHAVEELAILVEEVYHPLLNNRLNQVHWPEELRKDIEKKVQCLRDVASEAKGTLLQRTVLPTPVALDTLMELRSQILDEGRHDLCGVKLRSAVETIVNRWCMQINDAVERNDLEKARPELSPRQLTPDMEIAFWQMRHENLENIYEQVQRPPARTATLVLERIGSVYSGSFRATFRSLVTALQEARDITLWLKPLEPHVDRIRGSDIHTCKKHIRQFLYCFCLMGAHSKYNKNSRNAAFFRMIINLLIQESQRSLNPAALFQCDADEGLSRIQTVVDVMDDFRMAFNEFRERLPEFTRYGNVVAWGFQPEVVFVDFEQFRERLSTVAEILKSAKDYCRLDKMEIGGIKGRAMGQRLEESFKEYHAEYEKWITIKFNPLDLEINKAVFNTQFKAYQSFCDAFERKLSSIFIKSFEDCRNFDAALKLIEMAGPMMKRVQVFVEIQPQMEFIVDLYLRDVEFVSREYKRGMQGYEDSGLAGIPYCKASFAPVSGTLMWIKSLKGHIGDPIKDLDVLDFPIFEGDFGERTMKKSADLMQELDSFADRIFDEWIERVPAAVERNVGKFILVKSNNLLTVNYSPELNELIDEGKQMQVMGREQLPQCLIHLLGKVDSLWRVRSKLYDLCDRYNEFKEATNSYESALLNEKVQIVEEEVQRLSCAPSTWDAFDEAQVESLFQRIHTLYTQSHAIQGNILHILQSIEHWGQEPFYYRKDRNPKELLDLQGRQEILRARRMDCEKTRRQLSNAIDKNRQLFEVEGKEGRLQDLYSAYLKYVDGEVMSSLKLAVYQNLLYLEHEMQSPGIEPLFEVKLTETNNEIEFSPSLEDPLDKLGQETLIGQMERIIGDVCSMADVIPRVAQAQGKSYLIELGEDEDIGDVKRALRMRVLKSIKDMRSYVGKFDKYMFLWKNTMESTAQIDGPKMDEFKENIDFYYNLYEEVTQIEVTEVFDRWLILNMAGYRGSLIDRVNEWVQVLKSHLKRLAMERLDGLEKFMRDGRQILEIPVEKDNYDGLLRVMEVQMAIKEMRAKFTETFQPLLNIVELLRVYGEDFSQAIYSKLADIPDEWARLKRLSIQVKQEITPIKAYQVEQTSNKIANFDASTMAYRDHFLGLSIFTVPCSDVYQQCDYVNAVLNELEDQLKLLLISAKLFELPGPERFSLVALCRKETRLLKQLWDFVVCVESCINHWKLTPWKQIDVENMEQECKLFTKNIRLLAKEVRDWMPFMHLEAVLKNLITSMRAITELQNPAIRDRHWLELMKVTRLLEKYDMQELVLFRSNDDTTLESLLKLNLHNHEDEVKNIVDKSVKERYMEKTLVELAETWSRMSFDSEIHDRTKLTLLRASEELLETLDDNQVQLQNLAASKHVMYFFKEVSEWQQRLSDLDQIMTSWFDVQRKWIYLENIFIGSEDIRNQLPEDTGRFDDIDEGFKGILMQIGNNFHVLHIASIDRLQTTLDSLGQMLVLCEKALNNYLECKRLAFPRFYFVSSTDLLNILSNGIRPEYVCRHLNKLYDSLANLQFQSQSKAAIGMFAKDNEYVEFCEPCECTGKVESWLNEITRTMQATLHKLLARAVHSYDEKPRDQWVFNWPAQTALCGTQIAWTTEMKVAFEGLEEGYESSLKEFQKKQISQLNSLIMLLLGDLAAGDRQKIMTICTVDVHSRDVVAKLIAMQIDQESAFQWQSQLRHRWDELKGDCFANICDAEFKYDYEYLGNTARLVITPLTDRCYITLTQSLHLVMGGAPAGPAGTGKTETTKDLGRALGIMVYVFNCSEQMDYRSCGNIYKGLAQTGAWGCFDEFNRITVDVLSVVAVQVKSIQDAIKTHKTTFNFMGDMIKLVPTVGLFITMNPGYAGRTELPENLKALFRPCAMVVPDFALICEIMLVAEGFQEARLLARKFITLYTLCKELLSNQDHYDWGLRAIKSVLVVAGSLKRSDYQRPEDQVLMRALRDFNIPKIITNDIPVFMGLIGDLFPLVDVPRKRNMDFEKLVRKSAIELKLQAENNFLLKVVQLEELFAVRHSVFIVGNAGTGKTQIWRTLFRTYQNDNKKPFYNDLNPKAVTTDELYGYINPATREWKDGLFSLLMRDQANMVGFGPKWIVLDGDIDPMWIESLNTVMDDNKVLTLASNERISLTKDMRLLFEIGHLKYATPATVSRAGILYINPQDLGWYPFVASWIESRPSAAEKTILTICFEKYIPHLVASVRKFKTIIPINDNIAMIQMTCHLLDCLLIPPAVTEDTAKDVYERYFVFAAIWGFGAALFQDQFIDWRYEFSKWWQGTFSDVGFPDDTSVFNYYIDPVSKEFRRWNRLLPDTGELIDLDVSLQAILIPTAETNRLKYFMDVLMSKRFPIMLVGASGSGKSVIVSGKLSTLPDDYMVTNIPFNFYTTSQMLQAVMESPLEKKTGRKFGPPGMKKLIYFIDDINMPEVDAFGTVQPHTIIRQFMDFGHWYDRNRLTIKEIHNCQMVCCMNPSAGSFTIDPRLQRHFMTFSVNFPSPESLEQIYGTILTQHLATPGNKFSPGVQRMAPQVIDAALTLHTRMSQMFLPTAIKFHYIFNMRDLANIFTGILFTHDGCEDINALARLYIHEATRVYCDKLVSQKDINSFRKLIREVARKSFEDCDETKMFLEPIIYCHFAEGLTDPKYMPVTDWNRLGQLLEQAQEAYNDTVGHMDLVLFEDAMSHVCRISRILEAPRGNALLIGVGGSGKQSLARLAAFISSLSVFQLQLRKDYGIADLKADLASLYMKVGVKNVPSMFLMSQVGADEFLVLINDLLASGEIPDLFTGDEIDSICMSVKNEVKQSGVLDTKQNCWSFFIEKVRRNLKVVLCFSPIGPSLRARARKFPAIVNCTACDWFHEWPGTALESVSFKFLSKLEVLPPELTTSVAEFMSYVHGTVNQVSETFYQNEKRRNYTTPKSFLELIALYIKLLTAKTEQSKQRILRLENGLTKLSECSKQVDQLKSQLAEQEVHLRNKNEAADKLIVVVSAENETVQREKNLAALEEVKVRRIEEEVSISAKLCEEDLRMAEPALIAAQQALNTLNKNNLTELRSFGAPPDAVVKVCAAVIILFCNGKIPKDRSWRAAKYIMGKVDSFLNDLVCYDKEHIHPKIVEALQPYLEDPEFDPEKIMGKSVAAAGLCAWVININQFYEVYQIVEPKQRALQEAKDSLKAARDRLEFLNLKIVELEKRLHVIKSEFEGAIAEKQMCQREADKTAFKIDLAHRLISGLASENVRWRESISQSRIMIDHLPGDALLIACFLCYVGPFTKKYRCDLLERLWIPTFTNITPLIPHSCGNDPLSLICDDAQIAEWNNEGLPSDRMSTENATILANSTRWPLLIDPQLQGIKWIKQRYSTTLVVLRCNQKGFMDAIEEAIREGSTVLLENIEESLDAVLDPLLERAFIRKGKFIKIGDKEIDYNPNFRLILQTKMGNPHYKPEIQAQTTLINFTVTRDGLEDQLLTEVVKVERPDLELQKAELTQQQNSFKISLKALEDDLLRRLARAGDNILEDPTLVYNLEKTKKMAESIECKVMEARVTSSQIDIARENYRTVAERASLLYFILNDLHKINPIYQFSLKAFIEVFLKAIVKAPASKTFKERVRHLLESITHSVFTYTCRGLFEQDKLIFMTQLVIQILMHAGQVKQIELDFLLRYPYIPNLLSPFEHITNISWGGIKALALIEDFRGLDKDFEMSAKRWKKFLESETPELIKLPGEWKSKSGLQKLCIIRALRPDRMTYAIRSFVEEKLGRHYVNTRKVEFSKSFEESSSSTLIFFILSPGVDPLVDVERLGSQLGYTEAEGNFANISLGQGQEVVAEAALDYAVANGTWLILQNVHLVSKWLPVLEKKIEASQEEFVHESFRLFISAEPAPSPEYHCIPQGIIESAIKITNEPPAGMKANLHQCLDNFNQETLEMCTKEPEFKAILFSLCYFHAVIAERRKFGAQGWNKNYPFNVGDLTISVYVLYNYLETNTRVPWEDLRYLFGEIMYGGHITDDWDRRLCKTYLEVYMQPDLVDGELSLCPGFLIPPNTNYEGYHQYIEEQLPIESPHLYGLHPNAEIGFLTNVSDNLFKTVLELQPRGDSGSSSAAAISKEDSVRMIIEDLSDKVPEEYNIVEMMTRIEDRSPFVVVAFQECERMNILVREIKRSLKELHLGLKGELTVTQSMDQLQSSLFFDRIPETWARLAYPSLLGLQSWWADMILRFKELEHWSSDFVLPASVWLAGFFNPQSFLTAIMQQTARRNELPLDRMCLCCEVTQKFREDFTVPPLEGAFINGIFMEGARWDIEENCIGVAHLKELFPMLPVIYVKAITQDKQASKNIYECPLYKTRVRESTYVWTFDLKSRENPSKWILGGVCLLLQL